MADTEQEFVLGFVDIRRQKFGQESGGANSEISNFGNNNLGGPYMSVAALRTQLAALNGAYYTTARLNTMTKNDMVYAVRTFGVDSPGIKQ